MTITRAQVSKQVKTPPKPKKKPTTPKEAKKMKKSLESANRATEGDRAISYGKYKCGGKVKKKK